MEGTSASGAWHDAASVSRLVMATVATAVRRVRSCIVYER